MTPKKLSNEIVALLLPRLADEFKAYYAYRAIANWCKNVGYFKAAAFFEAESADELSHAKKIENFLTDWNVTPALPTISAPQTDFKNLKQTIEVAYQMEYDLYEEYEDTSAKVFKTSDLCVFDFLQEFRTIQAKSVAEYSDKLNVLEGVSGSKFEFLLLEENLF